jgi:phosphomannomutase
MNEELVTELDIRGTADTGLTTEYAWNTGKAVADWLPTAGNIIVLYVPMGQPTAHAVIEGLRLQGRSVVDGGVGDKDAAIAHIKTSGLSGAVVIGIEESTGNIVIQIYKEDGALVDRQSGLMELAELIEAGNFVPAAVKGELTAIA